MKAWLKGALIFLIFPVVGLYGLTTCQEFNCLLWLPFAVAAIFIEGPEKPLFHIVNFILYLVIGAVIGWVIGKIKSKK